MTKLIVAFRNLAKTSMCVFCLSLICPPGRMAVQIASSQWSNAGGHSEFEQQSPAALTSLWRLRTTIRTPDYPPISPNLNLNVCCPYFLSPSSVQPRHFAIWSLLKTITAFQHIPFPSIYISLCNARSPGTRFVPEDDEFLATFTSIPHETQSLLRLW